MADYTPLFVEPDVSALCDFFVAKVALHGCLLSRITLTLEDQKGGTAFLFNLFLQNHIYCFLQCPVEFF